MLRTELEPGDLICDSHGEPVIQHLGQSASILFAGSRRSWHDMAEGKISTSRWAEIVATRASIETNYSRDMDLPEEAIVKKPTAVETDTPSGNPRYVYE